MQMVPTILDFLSLRTFSSIWYWIAVAVTWAVVSYRPMGVPYDLVWRASHRRNGRAALEAVAGAFAQRLVTGAAGGGGMTVVATASAVLTALALLAIVYRLELAQGALLLASPLTLVVWLNLRAARKILAGGDAVRQLERLRLATNAIGLVSLFVTAFWGMYVNLMVSVL